MAAAIGSLPSPSASPTTAATPADATLGRHLARRLAEVGARDVFTVPGDFNLTLLDELEAEQPSGGGVRLVGCCNELNAAYAADGYARARPGGVGACAVTFTVGGLSAINAIAGAFSENLPLVCVVGGPNSNDYGSNRVLHHTIGLPDFTQELRCFQNVTCYQGRILVYILKYTAAPSKASTPAGATLGRHLARRLAEVGARDVFTVPGDFNLTLLDELEAEQPSGGGVRLVGCCNELNAAYAADGYARARPGGVGAYAVTFTVGGLSAINAVAGAFSENLPLVCVVGGPNSNDYGSNRVLHHTIGLPDFTQELRCFQNVTCYQAVVNNLGDAHEQIDTAISTALKESKPVYISISCNLPSIPHPTFSRHLVPFFLSPRLSNQMSLEAAVEAAAAFLNKSVKPVLVGGPKMRVAQACEAFVELADASGYPVAVMPSAKGLVPEHHSRFIGTYWGAVSTPFCAEIVESADAYMFAGPIFNDYSSVGYSLLIKKEKAIIVQPDRVVIGNGPAFGCILMKDFFHALASRLKKNTTAYENYRRIFVPQGKPLPSEPGEPLRVNVLFKHVQKMLSGNSAVIAETGDSWFNCQKLKLPEGCGYEFQMQYGSIGWSVGATLGYAQAAKDKRVISFIGDGSFQVTAQEVSTMIRWGQNNIIFLINNGGYTIEVEIHDGPYNVIKNWNYTGVVEAFHNGEGKCYTAKVQTEEELNKAIVASLESNKDCLCFIEVIVHKDDTSKELLEWGSRVSAANSRPPNPQ